MSRRVEHWANHIIRSTEMTESILEEARQWDFVEGADLDGLHAPRGPRRVRAAEGSEALARLRYTAPPKTPTVVDLPKGYYQARAKMNRERARRSA